ncbi:hypothetical protein IFT75_13960 [Pseudomonas sp. CFBP 8758]|uniref:Uncharacterized protein n=1 Tax=Pseudomonas baltica TaxID=2762576 RepID=A0A7X1KTV6_9PSED|nr:MULTISPECIES: hypothetical protein [Pseudomonas]MBC2679201.1 hypothetical protein [Pseudomonas baltica]MBD8594518.1 hypothetical protein [Pseudomonas sp. CFBP 8758]
MNRPQAAQASAQSQSMRQALFLVLATLVTLLAVQLYAGWASAQQQELLLPPQERLVDTAHLNPASAHWVGRQQSGNIERVQANEPVEHIRSWVF